MDAQASTYKLVLAYDGSDFRGWQRLPGKGRSVQETVERALARVLGEEIAVAGAGRTDAGVHALGQVASFSSGTRKPAASILKDLNAVLPADVAATWLEKADPRFHARHLALAKNYRYRILDAAPRNPLFRNYCHHVAEALDPASMRAAAAALTGKHNFQSFTNLKEKGKSFNREIFSIDIARIAPSAGTPSFLDILFRGDGFLHNQARIMASALIEAGAGRLSAGDIAAMLASRDRSLAPGAAPAAGLCLMSVEY